MTILWAALAVAFLIGLIKVTIKLLKLVFTLCFIGAVVLLLISLGIFL